MVSFDAPNREICTVERPRTNTPLQALVMLNDPQFVEASRNFAERILHCSTETDARMEFAFQEALARLPTAEEREIVRDTLTQELNRFRTSAGAAQDYRRAVLAPGGARAADALVRDFLGRDYGFEAFERWVTS